jgi:hypothetical protein
MRHYTGEPVPLTLLAEGGKRLRGNARFTPLTWRFGKDLNGRRSNRLSSDRRLVDASLDRHMSSQLFTYSHLAHALLCLM